MKEVGIDTIYQGLQSGIDNLQQAEHPMDEKDWGHQVGILITGNEAKILIGFIEASVELINAAKETIGTKPKVA